MLFILSRSKYVIGETLARVSWLCIILIYVATYFSLQAIFIYAGEEDLLRVYYYWYTVTATTIGFGDFSPQTELGRNAFANYAWIMLAEGGLVLGKFIEFFTVKIDRRKKGMDSYTGKNHVLILGDRGHETDEYIDEVMKDSRASNEIVLCASDGSERRPDLHKDVKFFAGDLTKRVTLNRLCAHDAQMIFVWTASDADTVLVALAVRDVNTTGRMLAVINDKENIARLKAVGCDSCNKHNEVLMSSIAARAAQETVDKGSNDTFEELYRQGGETQYTLLVPRAISIREVKELLDAREALLFSANEKLNLKPWSQVLPTGTQIGYIADKPIQDLFG